MKHPYINQTLNAYPFLLVCCLIIFQFSFLQAQLNNGIQGKIFVDQNQDGLDNDGVPPPLVLNIEVELLDAFGQPILSQFTDPNGQYFFQNIPAGDYFVHIPIIPPNHYIAFPGGDSQLEPIARIAGPLPVQEVQAPHVANAALIIGNPQQVTGQAWFDENFNGIRDPGEIPLEGIPIFLERPPFQAELEVTDEFGNYQFPYLPPNQDYGIQIPVPPEFGGFSPQDQGNDDNVDSDVDPNGQFVIPFNPPPPNPIIVDFGLTPKPLKVKVVGILGGAVRNDNEMGTELMDNGLLPTTEPYSGLGYAIQNPGVTFLPANIPNAVDWVTIELRDKDDSTQVVAHQSAIIKKDGCIVDPATNMPLCFAGLEKGSYFVALRHRNSLDVMTEAPVFLDDQEFTVDFSDPNTATVGVDAQKPLGNGKLGLWGGDANGDNELKYSGPGRDPADVLGIIGGTDPTQTTVPGYYLEDVNLDGIAKYSGPDRDPQIILENIGGTDPTQTRKSALPE